MKTFERILEQLKKKFSKIVEDEVEDKVLKRDETMTSRELVINSINFKPVERVPLEHGIARATILKYGERLIDILDKYPNDLGGRTRVIKEEDLHPSSRKGGYCDDWGCVWENAEAGYTGLCKGHPLEDWKSLDTYKFPALFPCRNELKIRYENVSKDDRESFAAGGPLGGVSGVFDRLQNLRGYENLMLDLAEEKEEVYQLLDRLTAYVCEGIDLSLEAKLDCIKFYDDWGTQESLIINPEQWRKIFKPRYKRLFDRVHQGGAYVYFHSCGHIIDIIPDLIEIGADIINPQISCMDLEKLIQITRGKVCIASDIDQQYVLPSGTPEEVKTFTRKILDAFKAREGGFIAITRPKTDWPLENLAAMLETIGEY